MRIIELDATHWRNALQFYEALLSAIGAPDWHGKSADALIDSMVWGGINSLEPPYKVRIFSAALAPTDVREEIERAVWALGVGREDYQKQEGDDVDVSMEIVS